jgi:voltage-gated potassium channel
MAEEREQKGTKERLARIVFKTDTPWAKGFDVLLLVAILLSVALVVVESYKGLHDAYSRFFYLAE